MKFYLNLFNQEFSIIYLKKFLRNFRILRKISTILNIIICLKTKILLHKVLYKTMR